MKKREIIFILVATLLPFYQVIAQQMERIPGQQPVESGDLVRFLDNLYKFGISITGILAIFMVALGAFFYIVTSAGNASKMMNAKDMITNALFGLVIALTAYLFLYVINPDLVGGTIKAPDEIIKGIKPSDTKDEIKKDLDNGTLCNKIGPGGSQSSPGEPSCERCKQTATTKPGTNMTVYECGSNW